jgi:aminopeptidase N
MPDLTRDEAAARAALLRVHRYEIDLDLTGAVDGGTFASTTSVRFACNRPGATTFVDLAAESIVEARLNGVAVYPAAAVDGRLILTDLLAGNELVVRARMRYSNAVEGIHRFVDPGDGEVYLYAQAGPAFAGNIFACFDQPDLKARVSLAVTAPAGWTVRANGAGAPTTPRRWEFAETAPISTYLMTVVAGPYTEVTAEHDGIGLGVLCRRTLAPLLADQAPEILALTRACFDRFHQLFGIRYPFGKYDQVFVPEFNWGAVENPGCVTLNEQFLFRSSTTRAERQRRAVVIAHEMAHMWFGDLVTLRWWHDIWLNESFAEYMGWRVTAEVTEYTDAWTTFAVERKAGGLVADQRPSTHPVAPDDVADLAQATLNFDGISYAKGASALRQLVVWLGDEVFLTGVRSYFAAHAYGNASLADLLAALTTASGRDLAAWAEVWLRRAQVNTLRPDVTLGADGRYEAVTVVQTAPPGYPTLRPHRIGVASYDSGGRRDQTTVDLEPELDNGRTAVAGLVGTEPGRLLLVNDGDLTFAKVRFDEASRAGLIEVLPSLPDPLARAVVWGAVVDATRDAEFRVPQYLALAAAALPHESQVATFGQILEFGHNVVADQYGDPADQPAALSGLARACAQVLDRGPSDTLVAAARGFVRCAGPDELPRITGWLAGRDVPAGLTVDIDLRWAILYRLVVLGQAGEPDIAAQGELDLSAPGLEHAARCRAAIADPAVKARTWARVTSDETASSRLLTAAAEGFWQPEQAVLGLSYVDRYFAELPTLADRRTSNVVRPLARSLYPRFAVSPTTVDLADAMLARADLDPALRRVAVDATDDLRRAVAVRALA